MENEVTRPVVDDHDLKLDAVLPERAPDGPFKRSCRVETGDDHPDGTESFAHTIPY
jgi:hypothetical protein